MAEEGREGMAASDWQQERTVVQPSAAPAVSFSGKRTTAKARIGVYRAIRGTK